jgi:hypothetical protein
MDHHCGTCPICLSRQELARQLAEDSRMSDRVTARERQQILARFAGAPEEFRDLVEAFLEKPVDTSWDKLSEYFVKKMQSEEFVFASEPQPGQIGAGFVNQGYSREAQTFGTLKLNGVDVKVATRAELAGKTEPKDYWTLGEGLIAFYIDVPMSLVWGDMGYEQALAFISLGANFYNSENSMEKALARQLEPMSKSMKDRLQKEITEAEHAVEVAHSTIREKVGIVQNRLLQLRSLELGVPVSDLAQRLRILIRGGGFANIMIDDRGIHAIAKNVAIDWHGYNFKLGDFHIDLSLKDGHTNVKYLTPISNLSQRQTQNNIGTVAGNSHPHIRGTQLCLGTFQGAITKSVLSQDLDVALTQVRRWLCSFNENDSYTKIWEWLPDRYYRVVALANNRANDSRPWEADEDPTAGPGESPTNQDYSECMKRSEKLANEARTPKLRCLDKPFAECASCPMFQNRDTLYDTCIAQVPFPSCMKCGDLNCRHLPKSEETCLKVQEDKAKKGLEGVLDDVDLQVEEDSVGILACVSCPFDRKDVCTMGESAFENCYTVQAPFAEDERACGHCEHTACPHNPKAETTRRRRR